MAVTAARVLDEGRAVELSFGARNARFHALWLRDNALDAETRSPTNGQRLITVLDIPKETRIAATKIDPSGDLEVVFSPEQRSVSFPAEWLAERVYDRQLERVPGWTGAAIERWDAKLQSHVPTADYPTVAADRGGLGVWLAAIRRYGFAVLIGNGGGGRTRTCEGIASGFTVRPLCRSGHSPIAGSNRPKS